MTKEKRTATYMIFSEVSSWLLSRVEGSRDNVRMRQANSTEIINFLELIPLQCEV